jgi:hypothetical protein
VSSLWFGVAPPFLQLTRRAALAVCRGQSTSHLRPLNDLTGYETIQIALRYAQFAGNIQSDQATCVD